MDQAASIDAGETPRRSTSKLDHMKRPRSVLRNIVAPILGAVATIPTLAIAVWETLHGHGAASYSNVYGLAIPYVMGFLPESTHPLSSATPALRPPMLHSDFHVTVKLAPSEASDDGRAVTLELLVPFFVVTDFCTASP